MRISAPSVSSSFITSSRRLALLAAAAGAAVCGLSHSAAAGELGPVENITGDADSGISADFEYTHKLDFHPDNNFTTVNGVRFDSAGRTGPHWTGTNMAGNIPEEAGLNGGGSSGIANDQDGMHRAMLDFVYNGVGDPAFISEVLEVKHLIPGARYEFRAYWRQWDSNPINTRNTTLRFEEELGTPDFKEITVNQDLDDAAHAISYTYTAGPSGTLTTTYTEAGNIPAASWHHYLTTNRLVDPGPYQPVDGLSNTGVTGPNLPHGFNETVLNLPAATDPHYTVTLPDASTVPAKVITQANQAAYFNNSGNSRFVNHTGSASGLGLNGVAAPGTYVFTTMFELDEQFDAASVILQGGVLVDNDLTDIRINGTSTFIAGSGFGVDNWIQFSITDDLFQTGANTIEFVTFNAGDTNNPYGFRLDGLRAYALPGNVDPWRVADINGDGQVSVADVGILATNFGLTIEGGRSVGDVNLDGSITVADVGIVATFFGQPGAGLNDGSDGTFADALELYPALGAVPEPSTLGFLLLGAPMLAGRRRGRRG